MAIRTVTGTIRTPTGDPWADFEIDFTIQPSTFTLAANFPEETVTATTGPAGTFTIDLEAGLEYDVGLRTVYIVNGSSTRYPPGSRFEVVVPEGEGPISLETLRAAETPIPDDPSVLTLIEPLQDAMVPAAGLTGQALTKATEADYDMAWADVEGVAGPDGDSAYEVAVLNGFTGDITAWLASLQGEPGEPGQQGDPGPGVPVGGTAGQVVSKVDATNYNTAWVDPGGGAELAGDGAAETAARSDHEHVGAEATALAVGSFATAEGLNSTAIGYNAHADLDSGTAVGMFANADRSQTTAIGRSTRTLHARSIAIGYLASASGPDTAVIKTNDLDLQRSNGTGATRISLRSPNGTKYWLSVDDTGTLDVTPA